MSQSRTLRLVQPKRRYPPPKSHGPNNCFVQSVPVRLPAATDNNRCKPDSPVGPATAGNGSIAVERQQVVRPSPQNANSQNIQLWIG